MYVEHEATAADCNYFSPIEYILPTSKRLEEGHLKGTISQNGMTYLVKICRLVIFVDRFNFFPYLIFQTNFFTLQFASSLVHNE